VFLVEMDVRIGSHDGFSNDAVTELIERVVDELDHLPVDPSVGTARVGEALDMTIGVVVDDPDEFSALRAGAATIAVTLETVLGAGISNLVADAGLRGSVRQLQPA
jgi:hypothetical protein